MEPLFSIATLLALLIAAVLGHALVIQTGRAERFDRYRRHAEIERDQALDAFARVEATIREVEAERAISAAEAATRARVAIWEAEDAGKKAAYSDILAQARAAAGRAEDRANAARAAELAEIAAKVTK